MQKVRLVPVLVVAGLALCPAAASAQSGLVELMLNQFVQNIVLSRTPGGAGIAQHTPEFESDPQRAAVTGLVQQVSQQIASQVSNTPLGSSSGGFTYTFDTSIGTFQRSADTFGPAFAERALTVGRGKFSFGMNYQHSKYSSLDGFDLEDGEIKIFLPHQRLANNFVDGDVVEAAVKLKLSSDTTVFFANYGVTDRLDVGLALPLQRISMDLTYRATIRDFATGVTAPGTHVFENGAKENDFTTSASASGLGDMVLRAKFGLAARGANAFAVGVDLRLPTGDEDDMLGTGATQAQVFLIASSTRGALSPHVNIGFTAVGGNDNASPQFNYVGGVEYAASPKVTLLGDLIGRTYTGASRLTNTSLTHQFRQSNGGPLESVELDTVATEDGSVTSLLGTIGAKFNPARNFLISAHLLFSLNGGGLRRGLTPVLGFDYSF